MRNILWNISLAQFTKSPTPVSDISKMRIRVNLIEMKINYYQYSQIIFNQMMFNKMNTF